MNAPITVTTTRAVWLSSYHSPADLMARVERGDSGAIVDMVSIYGDPKREAWAGYTRVGEADVTVRLLPRDEQTRMALAGLNAKLDQLRAAYLEKQQEILEEIQKLQALDYVEAQ